MIIKKCPNCSSEFSTYPSINKKHCSRKCEDELRVSNRFSKYKQKCLVCSVEFLPKRPTDGGSFCSYKCSGVSMRKDRVDRNGYWYICRPDHPNCSLQGYVAEHRLIVERDIGRLLRCDEVVHHINEDPKDNRIENLQVMSDSEHKSHHAKNRRRSKDGIYI